MTLCRDVVDAMGKIAPLHLAESWDNVGLLLGDAESPVRHLMTCLTVTPEVVAEAIEQRVEMIVTHHPLLYKPTQRITSASTEGQMLLQLMASRIAIYSAHTAYDNAPDGINDQLAGLLKLDELRPLTPFPPKAQFKIVIFVPEQDLRKVSEAAFQAGAGIIGKYEHCSFRTSGTGTFFGKENTQPKIGQAGRQEEVAEYRLEAVCPSACLARAVSAISQAHSYEEPAIDVYPLHPQSAKGSARDGAGRLGQLPVSVSAQELTELISGLLNTPVLLTGDRALEQIKSVAIVCGAGGSLLPQVIESGAEAFLTGELRFHDELAAKAAGVSVIAAGHYATEQPGMEELARRLAQCLPQCRVWASCAEHNPAQWVTGSTKPRSD